MSAEKNVSTPSNDSNAMVLRALMLLQKNLFSADCKEAAELMHRAAELGSPQAYACLGQMYTYGIGVNRDVAKGQEYICLAAGMGCDFAESVMMEGTDQCGVPLNAELRKQILEAMSAEGDSELVHELAEYFGNQDMCDEEHLQKLGQLLSKRLPQEEQRQFVATAATMLGQQTSQELENSVVALQEGAAKGVLGAATYLASLYLEGRGVPQDYAKAAELLQGDAKAGSAQAMYMLSKLYDLGQGVEQSGTEALRYMKMAAERGYTDAKFTMGQLYRLGHNVEVDLEKAVEYLEAAVDAGHPGAMYVLAFMCFRGEGTEQNTLRCVALLRHAADEGHVDAMVSLAEFFQGGLGIDPRPDEAIYLLMKAAGLGSAKAEAILSRMLDV